MISQQVLILDSTQITSALECPQLHQLEYVESLVKINAYAPALTFQIPDKIAMGTLGHKYLEIYYDMLAKVPENPGFAARTALDFDPDKADKIEPEFPLDPDMRRKVRRRFEDYLMTYGGRDYTPLCKYAKRIGINELGNLCDVLEPQPLVEQGFSYTVFESAEFQFILEGRIDLMASANGEHIWMDHKWQGKEMLLHPKSIQFRNYALATKLNLGVINYVRLHEKISDKTFVRQPISFSTQELHYWEQELTDIYREIARSLQHHHDFGVERFKNRSRCPGKFGQPCQFTPVCDTYEPRQRAALKAQDYTKRKEWRPW